MDQGHGAYCVPNKRLKRKGEAEKTSGKEERKRWRKLWKHLEKQDQTLYGGKDSVVAYALRWGEKV